jgi:hypothetical protein
MGPAKWPVRHGTAVPPVIGGACCNLPTDYPAATHAGHGRCGHAETLEVCIMRVCGVQILFPRPACVLRSCGPPGDLGSFAASLRVLRPSMPGFDSCIPCGHPSFYQSCTLARRRWSVLGRCTFTSDEPTLKATHGKRSLTWVQSQAPVYTFVCAGRHLESLSGCCSASELYP